MLALILKLGDEEEIVEITNLDLNIFLESLKKSTILDVDGNAWIIDPDEELYFEAYPPHFQIACKEKD